MSSDYEKGYRGEPGVNNSEYQRGQQDSGGAFNPPPSEPAPSYLPPGRGGLDLTRFRAAAVEMGKEWAVDPDRTVKGILKVMLGFTILGGILGALAGNWLHDGGLWLSFSKAFFFFASIVYVPMIVGATLGGRGTARGCLTIVFLGGLSAFFVWTYALYPAIFIHIR